MVQHGACRGEAGLCPAGRYSWFTHSCPQHEANLLAKAQRNDLGVKPQFSVIMKLIV